MINEYSSIAKYTESALKDKGSKFYGIAFPISNLAEFKTQMDIIKTKFPKATHYCYAYRIGFDKTNFRSFDDGEPSGSAGKPILGQIDSFNLCNIAIVVVRYYGGINLGVPGLIAAYKESAKLALNSGEIIKNKIYQVIEFDTNYSDLSKTLKIIENLGGLIIELKLESDCKVIAKLPIPIPNLEEKIPFGVSVKFTLKEII